MGFKEISPSIIRDMNTDLTGEETLFPSYTNPFLVFFSSVDYYEDTELKISSIVNNIVKMHLFGNGNKRTGFATFCVLCRMNNLEIRDKEWGILFEEIAAKKLSVEEVRGILFH